MLPHRRPRRPSGRLLQGEPDVFYEGRDIAGVVRQDGGRWTWPRMRVARSPMRESAALRVIMEDCSRWTYRRVRIAASGRRLDGVSGRQEGPDMKTRRPGQGHATTTGRGQSSQLVRRPRLDLAGAPTSAPPRPDAEAGRRGQRRRRDAGPPRWTTPAAGARGGHDGRTHLPRGVGRRRTRLVFRGVMGDAIATAPGPYRGSAISADVAQARGYWSATGGRAWGAWLRGFAAARPALFSRSGVSPGPTPCCIRSGPTSLGVGATGACASTKRPPAPGFGSTCIRRCVGPSRREGPCVQ